MINDILDKIANKIILNFQKILVILSFDLDVYIES